MSGDFSIVYDLFYVRSMGYTKSEIAVTELCYFKSSLSHIIAEILAVGTGISYELPLIK